MKNKNKEKKFFNLPTYPGGVKALGKFLNDNIQYPAEAQKNRIEGLVHVSFDVDHFAKISNEKIVRSLGFGCDEEALRVIKLLKFNKTFNRGTRVKKKMKLRIPFSSKAPATGFVYQYTEEKPAVESQELPENNSTGYGYTINF